MTFSKVINDDGLVTKITDLNGNSAGYGYDAAGRLIWLDLPDPWLDTFITWQEDDAFGLERTALRCKLNDYRSGCNAGTEKQRSVAQFDGFYRVIAEKQSDLANGIERHVNYRYDSRHNVTFESYPSGQSGETNGTTREYDALGREVKISVTGGGDIVTHYQGENSIRVFNPRGYSTRTTYLAYGEPSYSQPLVIQSPEGVTTTHAVNIFGDLTAITQTGPDKNGRGTVSQAEYRAYDSQHHLCKTVRSDVGTTVYGNDLLGKVQWHASGVTTSSNTNCGSSATDSHKVLFKYDNLGSERKVLYPDATPDLDYVLDNNGNVKTLIAGGVRQTYNYNALGLVEDERLQVDGKNYWVDYGYDTLGNVESLQYPGGDKVTFAPNAFGEPSQAVRQARSGRSAFTYASSAKYYPNGIVDSFTYGNGLSHRTLLNDRKVPYSIADSRYGFTALHYEYSYDDALNVTSITDGVNSSYSLNALTPYATTD